MAMAMNEFMWGGDHYVTQVNPDHMDCAKTHSCRDFADYDTNLIAVAHGVPQHIRSIKQCCIGSIHTGIHRCAATRGSQWTSELHYDGKARKLLGDVKAFDAQIDAKGPPPVYVDT